jgi:hypothetical protein
VYAFLQCRKDITDYSHFYNEILETGKCPLYSDSEKLHEEERNKAAKEARAALAKA